MSIFKRNTPTPSIEELAAAAQAKARKALAVFSDIAQDIFDAADNLDELSSQRAADADALRAQAHVIGSKATAAVDESIDLYEQSTAMKARANKIAGLSL